jgi:hypothetical protein
MGYVAEDVSNHGTSAILCRHAIRQDEDTSMFGLTYFSSTSNAFHVEAKAAQLLWFIGSRVPTKIIIPELSSSNITNLVFISSYCLSQSPIIMSDDLYVNSFDSSASSQRLSGSVAVMKGLEFPQLVDGGSNKRSAKRQPCFPSKKPRISKVPRRLEYMKEDDSWIDNFSILESMLPESDVLDAGIFPKLVSSLASIVDAAIASITSPIHGERAEESATTTYVPIQTLPPLQPSAIPLHESLGSAANVPLPEANNLMESRAVKVITPSLVPMECPPHYIPQMKDSEHIILDSPRPVIGQSSNGIEDSGDFSIERLKVSKEPT